MRFWRKNCYIYSFLKRFTWWSSINYSAVTNPITKARYHVSWALSFILHQTWILQGGVPWQFISRIYHLYWLVAATAYNINWAIISLQLTSFSCFGLKSKSFLFVSCFIIFPDILGMLVLHLFASFAYCFSLTGASTLPAAETQSRVDRYAVQSAAERA